jgi:hypothetical protein
VVPLDAQPDEDVHFGMNPYNDNEEYDVEMEEPIWPLQSLGARKLLLSCVSAVSSVDVAAADTVAADVVAAAAADTVADYGVAAGKADFAADAQRLPSGQISQGQEQDSGIIVVNLIYQQRLKCGREIISSKVGLKVAVRQGKGRQQKQIE